MTMTRREFLGTTLAVAATTTLPTSSRAAAPLKVLVLGGTGFLGPHTVRRLQERGHTVTLFNRGRTNPGLFPDIEKLRGDRKTDLKALEGRKWDAVLDPSAYIPADVTRSATLLAPNVGHYLLISTISVYKTLNTPGMDETAPLATLADPTVEQVTGETYGGLKVLCEQAAEKAMPGKTTVIRPGLIVGPGDTTDRFTYWPVRVARGGEVLAPNAPSDYVQCIDVRDLANFIVSCLEQRTTGIYNADGPQAGLTIGRLLETSKQVAKSDATFVWVPTAFLEAQKVRPWSDMPVWVPLTGDEAGGGQVSVKAAMAKGLTHRPLADTVRDTLAYVDTWPAERKAKLKAGLSPAREKEVLEAWRKRPI
ncbi:NAD-dependent epimerase/dehydratase family protein [Luteitalea sp.]